MQIPFDAGNVVEFTYFNINQQIVETVPIRATLHLFGREIKLICILFSYLERK